MPAEKRALRRLEQAVMRELELFAYPDKVWPHKSADADGAPVVDVLIVGAGQAGISLAVGLLREKITNILLVDRSPAGREGPWVTWARMITLRTIKELTGPDNRLPSASFRSWYEAQHGEQAWRDLVRIPKGDWMAYLGWVRDTLRLPVENETDVTSIVAEGHRLRVTMANAAGGRSVLARKVVLATGLDGTGGPRRPAFTDAIPRTLCAHSADHIDFSRIVGKRVAVLGAGASAFDNAATALEAGASTVTQFVRRPGLSQVNALRYLENSGFFRNFGSLDDERKIRLMRHYMTLPTPPPADTLQRCQIHSNFVARYGEEWTDMHEVGGALRITTSREVVEADFAILGTGFEVNLEQVPFLEPLVGQMVFWGDRMDLSQGTIDQRLAKYPYLGPAMQARGRTPESDRAIRNLHLFNIAGLPSVGLIASGINGLPWGTDAIAHAISRDLFLEDADRFYAAFVGYDQSDANEDYDRLTIAYRR